MTYLLLRGTLGQDISITGIVDVDIFEESCIGSIWNIAGRTGRSVRWFCVLVTRCVSILVRVIHTVNLLEQQF